MWLAERLGKAEVRVALGRDSRLSGCALAAAAAAGASSSGAAVTDVGLATTPAMFMCCVTEGYDQGWARFPIRV